MLTEKSITIIKNINTRILVLLEQLNINNVLNIQCCF